MIIIKNRVNSISSLLSTPREIGIHVDVRTYKDSLIVQHEPFTEGDSLEEYMENFSHKFIIFGIKSEGTESKVIEVAEKFKIENYFLLGVSPASAKKLMAKEFKKFAIRFSDMESLETCRLWAGRAEWVWVDIFRDFSLDEQSASVLKKSFRICTISPEMIGLRGALERYRGKMNMLKIDAVCTDMPELWK
ncbi:MAG: hypothetical protein QMD85_00390 [Candidatus Aenigmarchaeota archaeon]|nr:hypothetical protein [Candidatus Aenigmarchaeota archaeon]